MKVSASGKEKLVLLEALKLKAYRDSAGIWTIGVGHTGFVDGVAIHEGMTITRQKAMDLLDTDLAKFERVVNQNVNVPLTQSQFEALVFFLFNTGKLWGTTILRKLNAGDYDGARDAFRMWNKITVNGKKVVSNGLNNRREAEIRWWDNAKSSTPSTKASVVVAVTSASTVGAAADIATSGPSVANVGVLVLCAVIAVSIGIGIWLYKKHK